jgi:hypothetical protein
MDRYPAFFHGQNDEITDGRVGGRRLAPCGAGRLALVSSRPPSNRA